MGLMKEFKEFAVKGNVIDMAVGIVIGGAFGKIVSAFVGGVVMPALSPLTGGIDFSKLKYVMTAAATGVDGKEIAEVAIKYGAFFQTIFDFIIIAFAIFMVIKGINKMKKEEEAKPAPPAAPSAEENLLGEIRDLLKNQEK